MRLGSVTIEDALQKYRIECARLNLGGILDH
jgi:hypothetical protein